ncbi:unnamed protein product [Mytilus edulis]|uniref:Uncharacterized protein n=1 Tax=Mytilus edulis TaxID=6550 RepID=A0A8S3U0A6_MYTED|nr:unnamed protein product [Mytilus edulis]
MDGGKLRCRISESGDSEDLVGSVSEPLMLIPRNYCSCAEVNKRLEHPTKCDVYVECIEDGPKKYAFGKACENAHCINSEIGACSHNCSSNCTKDTLDYLDFCPTSPPPAKQSANGISITLETNIITISLQNVTCSLVGFYGVELNVSSNVTDQAEGELKMIKKPNGSAALNLHPDQFADLETGYRNWLLHSCIANVGSPAGSIQIEILQQGERQFRYLNITIHDQTDETVSCSIVRKMDFGISFTSDMDKAVIRCSIRHELFPDDPKIISNNETVSLLQKNFCENNTDDRTYFQHPSDCNSFIQCEKNVTYSKSCLTESLCFGSESKAACGNCDDVTCKKLSRYNNYQVANRTATM